jgi:hypothetical protein
MRTIRFARHHHPKDERAPNRFWCQIGVSPLKPIMVRLLSASPVEEVCERHRVFIGNCVFYKHGQYGSKVACPLLG